MTKWLVEIEVPEGRSYDYGISLDIPEPAEPSFIFTRNGVYVTSDPPWDDDEVFWTGQDPEDKVSGLPIVKWKFVKVLEGVPNDR